VNDPRVARIPGPPAAQIEGTVFAAPQVGRESDGSDLLLWKLTGLAGGSAVSLRYALPLLVLKSEPQVAAKFEPGIGFVLDPAAGQVLNTVRVSHLGTSDRRPELRLGDRIEAPAKVEGHEYVWHGIQLGGKGVWVVPPDDSFR
jgi:hypothetical protein